MRPATAVAAALVVAAAGLAVAGIVTAAEDDAPPPPTQARAAAPAPAGLAVWIQHGCGSCHTFAPAGATATVGPDLTLALRGADAAYIRRRIVDPGARTGFTMPEDFGERIPPKDLEALVAFLRSPAP